MNNLKLLGVMVCCSLVFGFPQSLHAESQPDSVKLQVSQLTADSVKITWNSLRSANRYELSYGLDAQATARGQFFKTELTHTFDRLMPGTVYRVKIRAIVAGRAQAWSPILEFSTQFPEIADLAAADVSDIGFQLSWGKRYQDLQDITFELAYGTGPEVQLSQTVQTKEFTYLLRQLNPDTTYYVRVRPRNSLTVGPWCRPLEVTTLPYSPGTAPAGLTIRQDQNGQLQVQWDAVKDAEGYELSFSQDPQFKNKKIIPLTETRSSLRLTPNSNYYFKVRSAIQGRKSYWGETRTILTLPDKPAELRVTGQTIDQVMISWQTADASPEHPLSYEVRWQPQGVLAAGGNTFTALTNYTFADFKSLVTFAIYVRSYNPSGPGPWSDPLTFQTLPKLTKNIQVFNLRHSTADIRWETQRGAEKYELAYGTDVEASNRETFEVEKSPTVLEQLLPGKSYYIKIRPILANQMYGAWSPITTFTTFPLPETPAQPQVRQVGGALAELLWPPVAATERYEVRLVLEGSDPEGTRLSANAPQVRATGLKSNTLYSAAVRAINPGGPGDWSEATSFCTLPDQAPAQIRVNNVTANEAVISWDGISGNAPVTYRIRYGLNQETWEWIKDNKSRAVNLQSLLPSTVYHLQIQAQNAFGQSPWSPDKTFKTMVAQPARAPENISLAAVNDISATIKWTALPEADGYRLSLDTGVGGMSTEVKHITATEYTLNHLSPETGYSVKLIAYNQIGEGPWSHSFEFVTLPSPPITAPSQVAIVETTSRTLVLDWQMDFTSVEYEVSLGTDALGENIVKAEKISRPPFTIQKLQPDTTYYVKVRKLNQGGNGPWTQLLKLRTPKED